MHVEIPYNMYTRALAIERAPSNFRFLTIYEHMELSEYPVFWGIS